MRKVILLLTALGIAGLVATPGADVNGHEVITRSAQSAQLGASLGSAYVVDSDFKAYRGRVLVVDANAGRVAGAINVGYKPDIALSRGGARLFVSSDREGGGTFQVIDTVSGSVLIDRPETYYRAGTPTAYRSRMSLSRDGEWLFRYKASRAEETGPNYWVEIFDIARGVVLPGTARLPLCGEATLLPSQRRDRLFVVCQDSRDVRVVAFGNDGQETSPVVRLGFGDGERAGYYPAAFFNTQGDTLTVIKTDGSFIRVSESKLAIVARGVVDGPARGINPQVAQGPASAGPPPSTDWLAGQVVQAFATSQDGSRLFLLTAGKGPAIGRIVVLDAQTLTRLRDFPVTRYYTDIAFDGMANRMLAIDHTRGEIVVIDADSGRESKVITDVGPGLGFALVPPS